MRSEKGAFTPEVDRVVKNFDIPSIESLEALEGLRSQLSKEWRKEWGDRCEKYSNAIKKTVKHLQAGDARVVQGALVSALGALRSGEIAGKMTQRYFSHKEINEGDRHPDDVMRADNAFNRVLNDALFSIISDGEHEERLEDLEAKSFQLLEKAEDDAKNNAFGMFHTPYSYQEVTDLREHYPEYAHFINESVNLLDEHRPFSQEEWRTIYQNLSRAVSIGGGDQDPLQSHVRLLIDLLSHVIEKVDGDNQDKDEVVDPNTVIDAVTVLVDNSSAYIDAKEIALSIREREHLLQKMNKQ